MWSYVQIEATAKASVSQIFEAEGEEAFREVETAVLQVGPSCGNPPPPPPGRGFKGLWPPCL